MTLLLLLLLLLPPPLRFWGIPRGIVERLDLFFVRPPFAIVCL
jgi:hypothetical protein